MRENWQGCCWHCGNELKGLDYNRENRCNQCGKAVHVCRNCHFFQTGIANACKETIAEPVAHKEQANFCDYFIAACHFEKTANNNDELLHAAEDLFS